MPGNLLKVVLQSSIRLFNMAVCWRKQGSYLWNWNIQTIKTHSNLNKDTSSYIKIYIKIKLLLFRNLGCVMCHSIYTKICKNIRLDISDNCVLDSRLCCHYIVTFYPLLTLRLLHKGYNINTYLNEIVECIVYILTY